MVRMMICVLWTLFAIWVGVNMMVFPSGAVWIGLAVLAWMVRIQAG